MGNSSVPKPLSPRNPSEGISNAWDFQEIPDCQSQELRLLSGIRDIFLVKAIMDWLNPQGAKLNCEVHIRAARRWRKGRKAGGKGWEAVYQLNASHTPKETSPLLHPLSGCPWGIAWSPASLGTSLEGTSSSCFLFLTMGSRWQDASLLSGTSEGMSKERQPSSALLWAEG